MLLLLMTALLMAQRGCFVSTADTWLRSVLFGAEGRQDGSKAKLCVCPQHRKQAARFPAPRITSAREPAGRQRARHGMCP